uniref:hypothetical protein n=1 Tax=Acinetobacter baumannii TaxID=470 RepID=UPI00339A20EC
AKLFKGRSLRSNMMCLDSSEVTYYRGNELRPSSGIIIKNLGKRMATILDTDDLTIHKRHIDQLRIMDKGESASIPSASADYNIPISDSGPTIQTPELRRSERLQNKAV